MNSEVKTASKDPRPYWKVAVSLAFSLAATILFIYFGIRFLIFFMPFVVGWFISYLVNPVVVWLEKRLKIVKKLGSAIIIIVVLGALVFIIYFAGNRIWREIVSLMQNMPEIYKEMESGMSEIGTAFAGIFAKLPESIQNGWHSIVENFDNTMGQLVAQISEPTVTAAGNIAKKIPSMLIATIVTFISAYFFIAEREDVIIWSKKIAPDPIVRRMTMVIDNLKYAIGGYFKAQMKIMVVVFAILLAGFLILQIHFYLLLALLIAFLDFLPFFGTGTAMIPWAVYHLATGNYKLAVALLIIYAITQLVRQLIQPKLVGDSMGLNPLITLLLLYIGYKVGSVLGMIFAVPIGLIVINLFKAGAFDYILDDVRILIKGVLSLRNDGY